MRTTALVTSLCAVAFSTSAFAQASGSSTIKIAEYWNVRSGWELASDDAYLGSRAGCFESLARIDFDSRLQPSLATSWVQTAPDTWEFTLRDNVKFQDGQPLDAAAASNALNKLLKAAVPARAFSPKLIKSVEAVGEKVVRITTVQPSVLLPSQLASPATTILSPNAYKDGKVDPINTCTGPFIIARADPTQGLTVKRNDAYWGGRPVLAGAEIRFIVDANARATQARTGEADLVRLVPASALGRLKSTPGLKVERFTVPRATMLLLNNKKPPLNDVNVRRAIQAAIDPESLAASVYEGAAQPAMGPFPPTDPWAPKQARPAYDPERAKTLLAQAGIKPGTLKLGLLAYSSRTEFKDVAAVIQEQLKAVGIQADIRVAEYNALEPDMLSGNYDLALMSRGYLTDAAEPAAYLNADYSCGGSYNISQYCTPEMDALIKEIFSTKDSATRMSLYSKVAEKIQSEAITTFLIHESLHDAYSTKVKNHRPHPLNYYMMTPTLAIN